MEGLRLRTALLCTATYLLVFSQTVRCTKCIYKGKEYEAGKHFKIPCFTCVCNGAMGVMDFSCVGDICETPQCVDPDWDTDRCCKNVCPNGRNCYAPDGTTIITEGETLVVDDNKTCMCQLNENQQFVLVCNKPREQEDTKILD